MKCSILILRALAVSSLATLSTLASATLLQNGSFEGAGLPSWANYGTTPSDFLNVYNNTGANSFFPPSAYGNFSGVTAHNGNQFIAAAVVGFAGYISQTLATPLVPGVEYTISGWLHRAARADLINVPATYEIFLCPSNSSQVGRISVGVFAPNAPFVNGWAYREVTFMAPPNAGTLPSVWLFGRLAPGQSIAYSALDSVELRPAAPATLNGTISLNDFAGPLDQETVDIILRGPSNTVIATYPDVPLAADGSYTVETAAFSNCTVSVRGRTWIRSRSNVANFVANEALTLDFTLDNGDADQSGEVDAADIDLIIANFGATLGDDTYNPNADLDGSTEVDAADIDIAIANFGETDE